MTLDVERSEVPNTLDEPAPRTLGVLDQGAFWGNLGVSLLGFSGALAVLAPAGVPQLSFLAAITECCVFARSDTRRLNPDVEISFAKQALFAEGAPVPEHCYTIIPGIVRPQSRGSVRLRSDSPRDPPLINPRHLAEPADVQGLVEGIELSRQIGEAGAFAEWSDGEVVPGRDSDLEQFVRCQTGLQVRAAEWVMFNRAMHLEEQLPEGEIRGESETTMRGIYREWKRLMGA